MSQHLREQWRKVASPGIRHLIDPDFEGEGFAQHRFETEGGYLLVNVFPAGWVQDEEELIGSDPARAVVDSVAVEETHRRQGVATRLFDYALSVLGPIYHSEWQTADGSAWAGAVGGPRWGDPETWRTEASLTQVLAATSTLWHVTDRRGFTIDPEHQPGGANGEVGIYGAGLFVTPNPELWHYLWRPQSEAGIYAAEVDAPPSVVQWLGIPGDDRDQGFIAARDLDQVTIRRVVPIGQAETEANAEGYGFAMIAADVIERSRICVIDHKAGWGNPMALCERVTDGNPIKWTTTAWVKDGPITDRICPECLEVLR